jgi:hypothetical protein
MKTKYKPNTHASLPLSHHGIKVDHKGEPWGNILPALWKKKSVIRTKASALCFDHKMAAHLQDAPNPLLKSEISADLPACDSLYLSV